MRNNDSIDDDDYVDDYYHRADNEQHSKQQYDHSRQRQYDNEA